MTRFGPPPPWMIIYSDSLYLFSFWMSKLYFVADSVHFFQSSDLQAIETFFRFPFPKHLVEECIQGGQVVLS